MAAEILFSSSAAAGEYEFRQSPRSLGFILSVVLGAETATVDLLSKASEDPADAFRSALDGGAVAGMTGTQQIQTDLESIRWKVVWSSLSGGSIKVFRTERGTEGLV
jgi:hypothetical protein